MLLNWMVPFISAFKKLYTVQYCKHIFNSIFLIIFSLEMLQAE